MDTHMHTHDQQGQGSTSDLLHTLLSYYQLEQTLGYMHMNNITAPSVVFWYGSMVPSVGGVGSLQLTVEGSNSLENYPVIYNPRYCRITTMGWRKKGDNTKLSRYAAQRCSLHVMPYWNVNASLLQPHLVYKTLMSLSVCLAYTLLNHTSNKLSQSV